MESVTVSSNGKLTASPTAIHDVLLLEPRVFGDRRGWFMESFNRETFAELGITHDFVQDNQSLSGRNVLRGLHYQLTQTQGKLVRVVAGEIFDVAVDIRRSSPTFGRWTAARLSSENKKMLWMPKGCAHGFLVLSDQAEVLYKATDYYAPESERTILWNDPDLKIHWPIQAEPILSSKDLSGESFKKAQLFP